jgi:hypothetical protein
MRLVSVRVMVACDDAVLVDQVKEAMREHLGALPVQTVGDKDATGRIHWSAIDVVRDVDRATPRKARKVTTGQGVLTT